MRYAYVTSLCGGDAYVPGVETLGRSLYETGTQVPRVAMVTGDVGAAARQRLHRQGFELVDIEPIASPSDKVNQLYPRFANTFTKLRAFGLAQYDKIVLLDADTLVVQNIDDLFERPGIAAAPDFFLPDRFNSGVLVLEPSRVQFDDIMQKLHRFGSYDGGDQGFLNEYFPGWYESPAAHRLPAGYNLHHFVFQFLISHTSLRERVLSEVKVIHFTLQKPWMGLMSSGGSEIWWKVFFAAHPEQETAWRRRLHKLEDWSFESVLRLLEK